MNNDTLNINSKRKIKIPADMLIGTKHETKNGGLLIVVEYITSLKVRIVFNGCTNVITTRAAHIRNGQVKTLW